MAITITCPKCNTKAEVPDEAQGCKGKCRGCGGVVHVPIRERKRCCVCAADVTSVKRGKDAEGNYYCERCWQRRVETARRKQTAVSAAEFGCSVCRQLFSVDQVYDMDGEFICKRCYATRRSTGIASEGEDSTSDLVKALGDIEVRGVLSQQQSVTCSMCHAHVPYDQVHEHNGKPVCGECIWKVGIPEAATTRGQPKPSLDGTRECPFCAERIQAKAKKCRFCGEMLLADDGTIPVSSDGSTQRYQAARTDYYNCAVCGGMFPPERVYSNASGYICHNCHSVTPRPTQSSSAFAGVTTRHQSRPQPNGLPKLVGIIVIVIVGGLAGLVAMNVFDSVASSPNSSDGQSADQHGPAIVLLSGLSFVEFDAKFCAQSRLTDLQKKSEIGSLKGDRVQWQGIVSRVTDDTVGFKHKATTISEDVELKMGTGETSKLITLNEGDLATYEGVIDDYGAVFSHTLTDGKIIAVKSTTQDERIKVLMETETQVLHQILGKDAGD